MSVPHRYTTYGLRIASELAVPWLPAGSEGAPDVTIRLGTVPGACAGGNAFWEARPGVFRLHVEGVARYQVTAGSDILVEPAGGDDHEVAIFLVGSVLGACLQQRGVLTLHASAIGTETGAVLFLGHSGAGKSTLLAALLARGHAMLADDVTGVVTGSNGRSEALPASPCLRLWADAVDALGLRERTGRWPKVRPQIDKYLVPAERFCRGARRVRAAYVLATHNRDAIEIDRLSRGDALEALLWCTYRRRFLQELGLQAAHFRAVSAVAKQAPLVRMTRPRHRPCVDVLADRIERDITGEGADGRPRADI